MTKEQMLEKENKQLKKDINKLKKDNKNKDREINKLLRQIKSARKTSIKRSLENE